MKSMKKIVSLALALMMICSAPMVTAFFGNVSAMDLPFIPIEPEKEGTYIDPFYYSLNDTTGEAIVTGYGGSQTDLSIPDTVEYEGKAYKVTAVGEYAFASDIALYSIALPLEIVTVEENAFSGCTNLGDVWFEGNEAQKLALSIGTGNTALTSAIWHYEACIYNPDAQKEHAFDNACDTTCNYCDFTRTASDHVFDDEHDVICNECGYLNMVLGDVDGNAEVTEDDAIYFLYYTFFPEYYPINSHHNLDYDKSGAVDLDDVFYLLYHYYFPERFPIDMPQ